MDNTATIKDPVCGMTVNSREALAHEHAGETYYFCSSHCRDKFAADPKAMLQPDDSAQATSAGTIYTCPMHPEIEQDQPGDCPKCGMALEASAPPKRKTQYTCPMHPEIVRDEPGECPKCGMALEPMTASGDEEDPELKAMTRRF
jgi:Cu+-exporting ATPase